MSNLESAPLEVYLGLKKLQKHWVYLLLLGIFLVILGGFAIIAANYTTMASIIVFGALLTIGGLLQIGYAFWGRRGEGFAQTLLSGILYTIVGALLWTHPTAGALAITLLLAAFYTVSGIFKIVLGLTNPVYRSGWLVLSGVISLALGLLIWAEWPSSALWLIGLFIGIDLIFTGWFWIMLSLSSKNLFKKH